MSELRKWKVACPPNKLNLVFPNEAGNPINHGNLLRRHFYPTLIASGYPIGWKSDFNKKKKGLRMII
jgi:hypothetical protein